MSRAGPSLLVLVALGSCDGGAAGPTAELDPFAVALTRHDGAWLAEAVELEARVTGPPATVTFVVDHEVLAVDASEPYLAMWPTRDGWNGEHLVEVRAETRELTATEQAILTVYNSADGPAPDAAWITAPDDPSWCGVVAIGAQAYEGLEALAVAVDGLPLAPPAADGLIRWDTLGAADGAHVLTAQITTETGVVQRALEVRVDNTAGCAAPALAFRTPQAGALVGDGTPVVLDFSSGGTAELRIAGVLVAQLEPPFAGELAIDAKRFEGLTDAILVAEALDDRGYVATATLPVALDLSPPDVVVTGLAPKDLIEGPLAVLVSATDASGPPSLVVHVDERAVASGIGSVVALVDAAPGPHVLGVSAVDQTGIFTVHEVPFTVASALEVTRLWAEEPLTEGSLVGWRTHTSEPATLTLTAGPLATTLDADTSPWTVEDPDCALTTGPLVVALTASTETATATAWTTVDAVARLDVDDSGSRLGRSAMLDAPDVELALATVHRAPVDVQWWLDGAQLTLEPLEATEEPSDGACLAAEHRWRWSPRDVPPGEHTLRWVVAGAGVTVADELTLFATADHDADGHLAVTMGGDDCDDGDPLTSPAALEQCDGEDDDCDGTIDEGCP